jgi:hypothetical protein
VVIGGHWWSLVVIGGYWWLLMVIGFYWWSLVLIDGYWCLIGGVVVGLFGFECVNLVVFVTLSVWYVLLC